MSIRGRLSSFYHSQNEALDVEEIHVALPGLHTPLAGSRAAVLADLHMPRLKPYHYRIHDAVKQAKPDFILIAGDTMDSRTRNVPELAPFFAHIARIAPCVAILGNNDCHRRRTPQLRALYEQAGIVLLENETRMLALRQSAIRITGLTDPHAFRLGVHRERPMANPTRVSMREALQPGRDREDKGIPTILLMHQPQIAGQYAELTPSLIVAGHAHGGQFRLPSMGGLYSPGQGLFPRYTSGLYEIEGSRLVVSRGLGTHDFPLRINNRPHIPVVVLEGEETGAFSTHLL